MQLVKVLIVSKHLEYEASCRVHALLLVIYIFMLNISKLIVNIIISVKGMQEVSDGLYRRLRMFNKFNITREATGNR